jgi:hypothetical protein
VKIKKKPETKTLINFVVLKEKVKCQKCNKNIKIGTKVVSHTVKEKVGQDAYAWGEKEVYYTCFACEKI